LANNRRVGISTKTLFVCRICVPDDDRFTLEVDDGQLFAVGRHTVTGRILQRVDSAAAPGRWREDGTLLSPVGGREDLHLPCLVVRDDEAVGRLYVGDTAWPTNHITIQNTDQLRAVLHNAKYT